MANASYQILVYNLAQSAKYFYLFQKRAAFQPPLSDSDILSNSLGCQQVANFDTSGAWIRFGLETQVYAGAVSTMAPVPPAQTESSFSLKANVALVSSTMAAREIALTTATGGESNSTILTLNPLGLSVPASQSGIPTGAFAMNVPSYTPASPPQLYCGVATMKDDETIVLSSFIAPPPKATFNCAPKQIFFVQVGYQPIGSRVTYTQTNAACCDFTTGAATIKVTYQADGTFSTQAV